MHDLEDITGEQIEAQLRQMETFVGSYTSEGFWVDEGIDPYEPESAYRLKGIIPEVAIYAADERFRVIVCIDGLVLLRMEQLAASIPPMGDPQRFEESLLWWGAHLDYANTLLLLIESESIKCEFSQEAIAEAVSISDTCRVDLLNGLPVNRRYPQRRSSLTARSDMTAWILGGMKTSLANEVIGDLGLWRTVKRPAIQKAIDRFTIASRDTDLVKLLSLVVKAKTAFKYNDYQVCFVLLWFVIESSLKKRFRQHPHEKRGFTSLANIVDRLRVTGSISDDIAEDVHMLRKIRNEQMHEPGSTVCTPRDCLQAAHIAIQFATEAIDLSLTMKWQTGSEF